MWEQTHIDSWTFDNKTASELCSWKDANNNVDNHTTKKESVLLKATSVHHLNVIVAFISMHYEYLCRLLRLYIPLYKYNDY
jgi:hypothetical protein